jgi:hypothetical protein
MKTGNMDFSGTRIQMPTVSVSDKAGLTGLNPGALIFVSDEVSGSGSTGVLNIYREGEGLKPLPTDNESNGYFSLLTDYFSGGSGTSNLIEVDDLGTWLDMDITVDVTYDNRVQAMKIANADFFDPVTKDFNLEGLTTQDHIVVSAGISYTPEIDFGTLRTRLLLTSHSGESTTSFEIEGSPLLMNSGADEQYATISSIPVFIGDLIDTNGIGDAGKFKIQFQPDVEGELILREYKVFIYTGGI